MGNGLDSIVAGSFPSRGNVLDVMPDRTATSSGSVLMGALIGPAFEACDSDGRLRWKRVRPASALSVSVRDAINEDCDASCLMKELVEPDTLGRLDTSDVLMDVLMDVL